MGVASGRLSWRQGDPVDFRPVDAARLPGEIAGQQVLAGDGVPLAFSVGDVIEPFGGGAVGVGFLDRQVGHERVRRRAVPVHRRPGAQIRQLGRRQRRGVHLNPPDDWRQGATHATHHC